MSNMEFGVTTEQAAKNIAEFGRQLKGVLKLYMTEEERREFEDPKTKRRRIKRIIKNAELRMQFDFVIGCD